MSQVKNPIYNGQTLLFALLIWWFASIIPLACSYFVIEFIERLFIDTDSLEWRFSNWPLVNMGVSALIGFSVSNIILNKISHSAYSDNRWWVKSFTDDSYFAGSFDLFQNSEKKEIALMYDKLGLTLYPTVKDIHKGYKKSKNKLINNQKYRSKFGPNPEQELDSIYYSICKIRNIKSILQ